MEPDWAAFYVEHRRALSTYALALTRDPAAAQDLLQDVLLRLMQEAPAPRHPRAYVLRCLRNRAIDLRRRAGPASLPLDAAGPALEAAPLPLFDPQRATTEQRDEIDRVMAALQGLADEPREAIVLKIFAGLTFAEIAETLGKPLGTVTSHYERGLRRLRELLEEPSNAARRQ